MLNENEIKSIQSEIADRGLSWTAGETFLTNMPDDKFKRLLGFVPGPNEPSFEQREQMAAANLQAFQAEAISDSFGAPASFDWRNKSGQNFITTVKDQANCGSCVAFGTIATVEGMIKIARGAGYSVDLSEAHLFYCIARSQGRNCDIGWFQDPPFDAFRDIGVADEACYPYVAGDANCTGRCTDWASRVVKISGYTVLTTIASMKEWLSTKGPLQACFTVYQDFQSYRGGVYVQTSNVWKGGHCICVVGYDDAQQCWICKNSWGPGFGESGYFRIRYGQVGIDARMVGVNSVVNTRWVRGKKVLGLWVHNSERNAFAYLSDEGWLKISARNDSAFINTLAELASAKASASNVDVYLDNGSITQLYVF